MKKLARLSKTGHCFRQTSEGFWPFTNKNRNMESELTDEAASTSTSAARKPLRAGMHSITPHIVCEGAAEAIEFYKKAFNAVELSRLASEDEKLMHAEIRIGDSVVMLVDESPEWGLVGPKSLKGSPVTLHLYVDDVDASVEQAVQAGAKVTVPVEDMFWGDRYGKLEDPFGHQWSIATHLREVSPEELKQGMDEMCG
jgi:PhnB protein